MTGHTDREQLEIERQERADFEASQAALLAEVAALRADRDAARAEADRYSYRKDWIEATNALRRAEADRDALAVTLEAVLVAFQAGDPVPTANAEATLREVLSRVTHTKAEQT